MDLRASRCIACSSLPAGCVAAVVGLLGLTVAPPSPLAAPPSPVPPGANRAIPTRSRVKAASSPAAATSLPFSSSLPGLVSRAAAEEGARRPRLPRLLDLAAIRMCVGGDPGGKDIVAVPAFIGLSGSFSLARATCSIRMTLTMMLIMIRGKPVLHQGRQLAVDGSPLVV